MTDLITQPALPVTDRPDWLEMMPRSVVAAFAYNDGCREKTAADLQTGHYGGIKLKAEMVVGMIGELQEETRGAITAWNTRSTEQLQARYEALLKLAEDETGWLIELPNAPHGGPLWVALETDAWPRTKTISKRSDHFEVEKYETPVRFTKDSNEALRLARKEDAEAFMRLFDNFLLHPVATEHAWPATQRQKDTEHG